MMQYTNDIIVARPNYCVPAVLEMVLNHHNISSFSQNDIAQQLNIVPADDSVDPELWGAHISDDTLNNFFAQNGIPLRERYISIHNFMDEYFMGEKIATLLVNGASIICGYNYTWLFGKKEDRFGHVSIIVSISDNFERVELLDPGPKNAGYKTVGSYDLFAAIKARNDGLWCIQPVSTTDNIQGEKKYK